MKTSKSVSASTKEKKIMNDRRFPPGWTAERVQKLVKTYDSLSEEQWIAEDEAAQEATSDQATVTVPLDLLPEIRRLLAGYKSA
jgi:hypothetical protein